MKRACFAAALLGLFLTGSPAMADDGGEGKSAGDLMVRLRGIGVFPQASDSSITGIGGHVDASDTFDPEADFTYFFTDNIAAELIAATTRHTISANGTALGNVAVGKVTLLPPTLTAQYHFMPKSAFSPYVGAGINYTWFFDSSPAGGTVTSVRYDNNFGAVLQAGVDYNVTDRWYLNLDVKQIFLSTTATLNGGAIKAKVDLNPTIVGAGVGYRF